MEPTTTVPMFESNQILSSTHLNQLRDYLDAEIKISRTRLTGVGIINGLNIKSYDKAAGKIVVTTGYGITTSGYLLELHPEAETCENTYQYYRPYFDPFDPEYNFGEKDIPKSDSSSSSGSESVLPAADSKSKFSPQSVKPAKASANPKKLVKGGGSEADIVPTIFELLTEEEAADADDAKFLSLFGDELDEMAVVLFLEEKSVELKTCTGTNCDNKGHKLELTVRLLLVPKDRLHTYDPQTLLTVPDPLSYISIPALSNNDLIAMNSATDLRNTYKAKVIEPQKTRLNDAIKQAYTNYGYLLGLTGKEVSDVPSWISNIGKGLQYIQYAMDALNDVTLTFNEFAEAAYDFFLSCGPVIFPFPRHLTLGLLKPTGDFIFDEYRTVLFQAPPIDRQDRKLAQAQLLFEKMLVLLKSFHVPGETGEEPVELKITPSKLTPVLLSERSLPFYYDTKNISSILKTWNPWQTLRGRQKERMGYFAGTYSSAPEFTQPFSFSTAEFPFLRIEGLGGKDKDDVLETLEKLKRKFNLAFDVIALRIDAEEFVLEDPTDCRFGDLEEEYLFHRQSLIDTVRALEDYYELINYYIYNTTDKKSQVNFDMAGKYISHFSKETNAVLPPCLRDFDYGKFKQAYKDLIALLLEFFRSSGLQHKLFQSIAPRDGKNADSAMSVLLSLASSILFTLIDMVYYRKLYRIWVSYTIRYHRGLKQTRFSSFAELNPGMAHQAGVDRGTFIVVYESVKIKKVTETVSGKGKKAMAKKADMTAAAPQPADAVAPAPASRYTILSDSKEPIRFAIETGLPGGKEMTAAIKLAEEKYYKLTDKARGKQVTVTEDIIEPPLTSNIVIADFMLPYQCCDNYHCMNMCISQDELSKLPIPPFAKDDFALTHVNMPVDIYPDMNDVAGLGNTIEITEIHDNTTITTVMGGSATLDTSGVRPHFIYTPPKNDDGFSDSFQYTIRNSTNGLTDTATVYIEVVPLPPAKISVANSTVCWNGTSQIINIDAPMRDPAKLKIEGPGVSFDEESGNWYFDPTGIAGGTYELSLTQDNKVIATCNVTVKKPVASFSLDSVHTYDSYIVLNLQNKSTEADQFEWSGSQFPTVYTYGTQNASIQVPKSLITKNGTVQVQLLATDTASGCQSSPTSQNILIPTASISLSKAAYCISDPAEAFVIQKGGIDTLTVIGPGVIYQNGNWMFDPAQSGLLTSGEVDFKLIDTTTGYTVASTVARIVIIQPDFSVGDVSVGTLNYMLKLDVMIDPNLQELVTFSFVNLTQPAEADSFSWAAQVGSTKLTSKLRNPSFTINASVLMEAQYQVNTDLVAKATTLSSCTKSINRKVDLSPYLAAGMLAKNASNTIGLLDTSDYKLLSDKVDTLYNSNTISFSSVELTNKLAAAAESTNTFVTDPVVYDSVKTGITEQPIDANAEALKLLTEAINVTETANSVAVADVYKATLNNYNSLLAASPNVLTKEELSNLETYTKTVSGLTDYTITDKLNTDLAIAESTDKATTKYLTDLSGIIG